MSSPLIQLRGGLSADRPAIVLVEVLVAAAILATTVALFVGVLVDGSANIARARVRSRQVMVAEELMALARENPAASQTGMTAGLPWTVECQRQREPQARLELVTCQVEVRAPEGSGRALSLRGAWAARRAASP